MQADAEAANQVIHMGLEIGDKAVRLAGLGAKNLAALILAILKDSKKLAGKTNLNRLLREGKPLTSYTMDKKAFSEFKKHAKVHGILVTAVRNFKGDNNLVDVVYQEENQRLFNAILEGMKQPIAKKDEAVKNAVARAQQGDKSKGRGFGWRLHRTERKNKGMENTLGNLSEAALVGILLELVQENAKQGKEGGALAQAIASKDFSPVLVDAQHMDKVQKSFNALGVQIPVVPGADGKVMLMAEAKDATLVNSAFQAIGQPPPMPVPAPEQKSSQKRQPKAPAEKTAKGSRSSAAKSKPTEPAKSSVSNSQPAEPARGGAGGKGEKMSVKDRVKAAQPQSNATRFAPENTQARAPKAAKAPTK